jgi:hypothetical protein
MDEAITQAPAGEQIAFDRTALNPTEAAKIASWQMTNRAPLEPPNRGLMDPLKGVEYSVSDG